MGGRGGGARHARPRKQVRVRVSPTDGTGDTMGRTTAVRWCTGGAAVANPVDKAVSSPATGNPATAPPPPHITRPGPGGPTIEPHTHAKGAADTSPNTEGDKGDPTHCAEGGTGDCPGPRKEISAGRNATQGAGCVCGGGGRGSLPSIHRRAPSPGVLANAHHHSNTRYHHRRPAQCHLLQGPHHHPPAPTPAPAPAWRRPCPSLRETERFHGLLCPIVLSLRFDRAAQPLDASTAQSSLPKTCFGAFGAEMGAQKWGLWCW